MDATGISASIDESDSESGERLSGEWFDCVQVCVPVPYGVIWRVVEDVLRYFVWYLYLNTLYLLIILFYQRKDCSSKEYKQDDNNVILLQSEPQNSYNQENMT